MLDEIKAEDLLDELKEILFYAFKEASDLRKYALIGYVQNGEEEDKIYLRYADGKMDGLWSIIRISGLSKEYEEWERKQRKHE